MRRETIKSRLERVALYYHLKYNHYPPVSDTFLPTAEAAIDAANRGEWDTVLSLPNGKELTVSTIIEELHLRDFLDTDEDTEGE